GLTLADERRLNAWLLASGIDIAGMNALRKHVSAIKGGRLAELLVGRPAAALVVSDVPGDDLAVIGSGPTVADPTTFAAALAIARAAGAVRPLPPRVVRHLVTGARGRVPETPKPGCERSSTSGRPSAERRCARRSVSPAVSGACSVRYAAPCRRS